ncbi:hypothetical protein ACJMK2_017739 [Sinanodonta woodiana]|uniref:DUF4524 domain-containing protein n=1 Tax=Sinanodonta woodiana TaxID=1069815 RepID=A0ABD3UDB1_SINWO
MPVVPTLMVLYTNDAVEVRYSDGSRLHLTPCGSTFFYHTATDGSHPVAGFNVVQQRCQFVTSQYRQKVMSALDFRNRFAERPFLAQEFLHQDQIIALYAKITSAAWAKSPEESSIEKLPDGSIRVTSVDNYASLILSPHKRDFTVCFLSLLSPEKNSDRSRLTSHKNKTKDFVNSDSVSKPVGTSGDSTEDKRKFVILREELNISPITQASSSNSPCGLSQASGSPVTPQIQQPGSNNRYMLFSTPTRGLEACELSADLEDPVCTPYGKTAVFRDYRQERQGGKISGTDLDIFVQKTHMSGSGHESKGEKKQTVLASGQGDNQRDIEDSIERGNNLVGRDHYQKENIIIGRENHQGSKDSKHRNVGESAEKSVLRSSRETTLTGISQTSDVSKNSVQQSSSDTSQETTQQLYCWVTKHISCDECPLNWSHVVRLALEAKDHPEQLAEGKPKEQKRKQDEGLGYPAKVNKDQCVHSVIPQPLPLTCTGQLLHKQQSKQIFEDEKTNTDDPTTFRQGRLKVMLIEGVVFRIVRLQTLKAVEIYPGDGTVIVSQGTAGHFFQHFIPQGDKIEERTYSIKNPPPTPPYATFCIERLMKRAARFLNYAKQEDSILPASSDICCWKYQDTMPQEPLPITVLEECVVPSYGRFVALSNGLVRIVFNDRTSLEITADFSKRTHQRSNAAEDLTQMHGIGDSSTSNFKKMSSVKKEGLCKLLLPNGQYQMVDISQPGVYKRHVDMALEWTAWVNSSPLERTSFYRNSEQDLSQQMCAERELQRIKTFNYIVDNTLKKQAGAIKIKNDKIKGEFQKTSQEFQTGHTHCKDSEAQYIFGTCLKDNARTGEVRYVYPVVGNQGTSSNSFNADKNRISVLHTYAHRDPVVPPVGTLNPIKPYSRPEGNHFIQRSAIGTHLTQSQFDMMNGFNAVREALLKTSSVIKDIDHILGKKNG